MLPSPRLLALASAVPPYALGQDEVVERVKRLFGSSAELDRLLPVFANSGIGRRYSSVPLEWYDEPHGWAERNRRYLTGALDLLEKEHLRLMRRLLDYPTAARSAPGSPLREEMRRSHESFTAVAVRIEHFDHELVHQQLGAAETERLTRLQSRLNLLVSIWRTTS